MSDPYNWKFPQRIDTMYLSTLEQKSKMIKIIPRESSFRLRDIEGTLPKQQNFCKVIQQYPIKSKIIQQNPELGKSGKKMRISSSLQINDIEGASSSPPGIKTNRTVNPLSPRYKLPTSDPMFIQPPKYLRNTLDISDIVPKKKIIVHPIKSNEDFNFKKPYKLFNKNQQLSKFNVKDINNQYKFISQRKNYPNNPLNPIYHWRDSVEFDKLQQYKKDKLDKQFQQMNKLDVQFRSLNTLYGDISGTKSKQLIPFSSKRQSSLDVRDIEGAHANSSNQNRYFLQKRKQFRNYMINNDIQKTQASSLKKGITTKRSVNPLMPNYNFVS